MPAGWKIVRGDLPQRLPDPGRYAGTMGRHSVLHLLEEFGF